MCTIQLENILKRPISPFQCGNDDQSMNDDVQGVFLYYCVDSNGLGNGVFLYYCVDSNGLGNLGSNKEIQAESCLQ